MPSPQATPPSLDFDQIEAAVTETLRGRWFLAEYARRHRHADTVAVLDAVGALRKAAVLRKSLLPYETFESDIGALARIVSRAERELLQVFRNREGQIATASAFEILHDMAAASGQSARELRQVSVGLGQAAQSERGSPTDQYTRAIDAASRRFEALGVGASVAAGALQALARRLEEMLEASGLADLGVTIPRPSVAGTAPPTAVDEAGVGASDPNREPDSDMFSFRASAA